MQDGGWILAQQNRTTKRLSGAYIFYGILLELLDFSTINKPEWLNIIDTCHFSMKNTLNTTSKVIHFLCIDIVYQLESRLYLASCFSVSTE